MTIPPLCIIQARYHSTRLPGKMLLKLGDETLIARAWRIACEAFGEQHCVVAVPSEDDRGPLAEELTGIGARVFWYTGSSQDLLGRFWACAHAYRKEPDSIIVRVTPDDVPIDVAREWFTLRHLDEVHALTQDPHLREHIGYALFPDRPLEVNTLADYEAAKARYAREKR